MDIDDKDISALIRACERDLDDPDLWRNPGGYPSSLALCVIDAIHSSASHYSAVVGIVGKYRTHRTRCGADPDLDGATDLAATFAEARQTSRWAIQMAPHGSTSVTAAAARKAEAVALLVDALLRADIDTTADLRLQLAHRTLSQPLNDCGVPFPDNDLAPRGYTPNYWPASPAPPPTA